MRILYSTACLAGARDQAAAIEQLRSADLAPLEAGPLAGDLERPAAEAGIAAAHLAFLPARSARCNLAAADDDLRGQAVKAISEALARCEWLGIPVYGVEAGWNLTATLLDHGTPVGAPGRRPHALAQLERSLDRLADRALERGLSLLVATMGPASGGLLAGPGEVRQVLGTVGAPNLAVAIDMEAWEAAARLAAPRFDPDAAACDLGSIVGALRLPVRGKPERWHVAVAAALGDARLVLVGGAAGVSPLRDGGARLREALHAPA
ncbi:MAG: TIM barrel protein [Candidatus Sericytochromatia bacterium]|nr:TIM barrel protein [Candidatus Tanganyikabacteria bacterium]